MTRPSAVTRARSPLALAAVAGVATGSGPGSSSASPATTTSSTTTAGADLATPRGDLQRVSAGKWYAALMQLAAKVGSTSVSAMSRRANQSGDHGEQAERYVTSGLSSRRADRPAWPGR